MEKIIIQGGRPLRGELSVAGSKNAALPIMVSFLLAPGTSTLTRVPDLRDVHTMLELLWSLGVQGQYSDGVVKLDTSRLTGHEAPYRLVSRMRASFYVLGPLLARLGRARVSLPGGCAWGPRPVDLHLKGLEALGAKIEVDHGDVVATARRLVGNRFEFEKSSVGATAQLLMAATLAKGTTELVNAAMEPEIPVLANILIDMGAKIHGAGTDTITIDGVSTLTPTTTANMADRIEAGTYLIAGAMTDGDITVTDFKPEWLDSLSDTLRRMGVEVEATASSLRAKGRRQPKPLTVTTEIYPGFPTDLQAQIMAYLSVADGDSEIIETIYHDRFAHVAELRRLGADITVDGNRARVRGVDAFQGAYVQSKDLRASASLILGGLIAEGETHVTHVHHLDRGYEHIEERLRELGADVTRVADPDGDE